METEGIWLSLILSTVVRIVRLVGNSCHAHFSSTSGLLLLCTVLHYFPKVFIHQFTQGTPFENAQRWMGKNTFPILLLNDDNMIGEHQDTRMKMPNMCPFEKKEKEVFFRLPNFFQEQKNFVQGTTFVQFFKYCKAKKNFRGIQKNFLLKFT